MYLLVVDIFLGLSRLQGINRRVDCRYNTIHKVHFLARHRVYKVSFTDNGPQFAAAESKVLPVNMDFTIRQAPPTSPSPIKKHREQYEPLRLCFKGLKTLSVYQTTPLQNDYSPAQLLRIDNFIHLYQLYHLNLNPQFLT